MTSVSSRSCSPVSGSTIGEALDGVAEHLDAQHRLVVGRVDLDGVAPHPELAPAERHVVAVVLEVDELAQDGALVVVDAGVQLEQVAPVLLGVAHAVDAADAGHHDDVAPGEERGGGAVAQPVDLVVDRAVLLDVGVARRDVGLGLVVVVVADEVLDPVVREELPELGGQLGGQALVGREDQRRPLHLLDRPGDGGALAGAGDAEQRLEAVAPRRCPRPGAPMACGWSPAGSKSDTTWNGGTGAQPTVPNACSERFGPANLVTGGARIRARTGDQLPIAGPRRRHTCGVTSTGRAGCAGSRGSAPPSTAALSRQVTVLGLDRPAPSTDGWNRRLWASMANRIDGIARSTRPTNRPQAHPGTRVLAHDRGMPGVAIEPLARAARTTTRTAATPDVLEVSARTGRCGCPAWPRQRAAALSREPIGTSSTACRARVWPGRSPTSAPSCRGRRASSGRSTTHQRRGPASSGSRRTATDACTGHGQPSTRVLLGLLEQDGRTAARSWFERPRRALPASPRLPSDRAAVDRPRRTRPVRRPPRPGAMPAIRLGVEAHSRQLPLRRRTPSRRPTSAATSAWRRPDGRCSTSADDDHRRRRPAAQTWSRRRHRRREVGQQRR